MATTVALVQLGAGVLVIAGAGVLLWLLSTWD